MSRYYFCANDGGTVDLQIGKHYPTIPDDEAESNGYLRVVDDSGEDYLYPARWFTRSPQSMNDPGPAVDVNITADERFSRIMANYVIPGLVVLIVASGVAMCIMMRPDMTAWGPPPYKVGDRVRIRSTGTEAVVIDYALAGTVYTEYADANGVIHEYNRPNRFFEPLRPAPGANIQEQPR